MCVQDTIQYANSQNGVNKLKIQPDTDWKASVHIQCAKLSILSHSWTFTARCFASPSFAFFSRLHSSDRERPFCTFMSRQWRWSGGIRKFRSCIKRSSRFVPPQENWTSEKPISDSIIYGTRWSIIKYWSSCTEDNTMLICIVNTKQASIGGCPPLEAKASESTLHASRTWWYGANGYVYFIMRGWTNLRTARANIEATIRDRSSEKKKETKDPTARRKWKDSWLVW